MAVNAPDAEVTRAKGKRARRRAGPANASVVMSPARNVSWDRQSTGKAEQSVSADNVAQEQEIEMSRPENSHADIRDFKLYASVLISFVVLSAWAVGLTLYFLI